MKKYLFLLVILVLSFTYLMLSLNNKSISYNENDNTFRPVHYEPHLLSDFSKGYSLNPLVTEGPDSNMTLNQNWPFGSSYTVYSEGQYLYAGFGAGLIIYQVNANGTLTWKADIRTTSRVLKIKKSGNYLYIANDKSGMTIYNVANPSNPVFVSSFPVTYGAQDIYIQGNYAYIADGWYGGYGGGYNYYFEGFFKIVNISNPSYPVLVFDTDLGGETTAVEVKGAYAYIMFITYSMWDGAHAKLRIYDISNPANPVWQSETDLGSPHNYTDDNSYITLKGNYAFVSFRFNGYKHIDISNIQAPLVIGTIALNNKDAFRFTQYDTTIILTERDFGLVKIGVSNPHYPSSPVYKPLDGYHFDVCYNNGYLFVASGDEGIYVLNASNMGVIEHRDFAHEGGNIVISGNNIFLGNGYKGIFVFNRFGFNLPVAGNWKNGQYVGAITKYNSYLYVAQSNSPVKILNVANPSNINQSGIISSSPSQVMDLTVYNNRLYMLHLTEGISIYSLSNPVNPAFLGSYNSPGREHRCRVRNNYAYLASDSAGIRVLNITNPASIQEEGFYDPPGQVYDIDLSGNYAVVAAGTQGLLVLDISNPIGPYLKNEYNINDETAIGIRVRNNIIYVTTSFNGLYVFYLNNNGSAVRFGHHKPKGIRNEIFWGNDITRPEVDEYNNVFLGCGVLGLHKLTTYYSIGIKNLSIDIPLEFELKQNYPNPFNPTTRIVFNIPKNDFVNISIYDINGRLIEVLQNGKVNSGIYETEWNAENYPSGVYFCKMETNTYRSVIKMIYLK